MWSKARAAFTTRALVDFQQPDLHRLVNHDVEAKELKALASVF